MNDASIANPFDAPHRMVELEHGKLAYWKFGSGPDVVFVHGWPLHGATWRGVVPQLSDSFTCHVFDLPGTGHTEWNDGGPVGLWEHAHTLAAAIDTLGVERYALVGHDSGATITRLLDTLHPGRVTAHVMGNTEIPGHVPPVLRGANYARFVPALRHLLKLAYRSDRVVDYMFETCFEKIDYVGGDFRRFFVTPMARDAAVAAGQLRLLYELDLDVVEEELGGVHARITAPVMLIWGERDPWFPWREAEAMVESFGGPAAEVHLFERGKLFVHEEYADEFGQVARDFLQSRA